MSKINKIKPIVRTSSDMREVKLDENANPYWITFNCKDLILWAYYITYEQICIIANLDPKLEPTVTYTADCKRRMYPGEECLIKDNTKITCRLKD